MTRATLNDPPTRQELESELASVQETRRTFENAFEQDRLDLEISAKIAAAREAEHRLERQIAEVRGREEEAAEASRRVALRDAYIVACKKIAKLQKEVEACVDALILHADELREHERDAARLADQLDVVPRCAPEPLWQKHGGTAVPYAHTVRAALRDL